MAFIRGSTRVYTGPTQPVRLLAHLDSAEATDRPATPAQTNRTDSYLTVLLKLVPAEVVSIYMAIRDSATQHHSLTFWFFACLAVCFVLRAQASLPKRDAQHPGGNKGAGNPVSRWIRDVQWTSVIVSCIAFLLWAFAIGPDRPVPALPLDQWLASALAALLSALAPIIVPGDRSAPGE